MKVLRIVLILFSALTWISCAMLKTHDKNEEVVQKIRKVAIVAFTETQPASAKVGLDLSSGTVSGKAGGSEISKMSPHVDKMYDALAAQLRKNLNWFVMDKSAMLSNSAYRMAYEKTMSGWQNKMPPGEGEYQYIIDKVMDADGPRILNQKGRDALLAALNVDALVEARIHVIVTGTSVLGIGARHPQAKVTFQIYTRGLPSAAWFDTVDGDEQESVGSTGFINEDLLSQRGLASAKTAFEKIGKN